MAFERIIHECDLAIENLRKGNPEEEIEMDVSFWECMKKALPELLTTLSEGDVLSHPFTANMAVDVISRAINHRTLGAPIWPIETAPRDWLANEQDIEKTLAFLESLYGTKNDDGYMLQNRRCPSIFYDPHTKTYSDIEKADGYFNDLTGIGWTGRPFDPEFAKKVVPGLFERLDMGRYNFDSEIHNFPYYPVTGHKSHPCTWEEECLWDFLDIISIGREVKPMTLHNFSYDNLQLTGYIILFRFDGFTDKDTYMLYVLPLMHYDPDTNTTTHKCIIHLMPYTLPYDMNANAKDTILKSHMDFMAKYLVKYPSSIGIFTSRCNLLEPEDNTNPMFNFFIPLDEVVENEEGGRLFIGGSIKHYEHDTYLKIAESTLSKDLYRNSDIYNAYIFDVAKPTDIPADAIPECVMQAACEVYALICRHDIKCMERRVQIQKAAEAFEKDDPTMSG